MSMCANKKNKEIYLGVDTVTSGLTKLILKT